MSDIATKLVSGCFAKFLVIAVFSTIGIPFLAVLLRPDLDYTFHLSDREQQSLKAQNFSAQVENNINALVRGHIDPDKSEFIAGFTEDNLLIRLKDFPQDFAIHIKPGERLTAQIRRHYDSHRDSLPDSDKITIGVKSMFGNGKPLSDFLSPTDDILQKERGFGGRMYNVSNGNGSRYKHHDDLRKSARNVQWLISDGETPSFGGLLASNGGLFAFMVGLAGLIGIPTLLILLSSSKTKRLEKKARKAESARTEDPISTNTISTVLRRKERIDSRANQNLLNQRLWEFLKTPSGRLIREKFTMPMWLRYVSMMVMIILGLIALPTIVFTRGGASLLWSAIKLEPFQDLQGKKIDESLRIVIASMIIANEQILTGQVEEGPALLLGTFEADEQFTLEIQSDLASHLASIYLHGPTDDEENEVFLLLHDDTFQDNRRRSLPAAIAGSADVLLLDMNLNVRLAKIISRDKILVACVVDPREDGEIYQIPWATVADLVKDH